jgi:hypothetical protein
MPPMNEQGILPYPHLPPEEIFDRIVCSVGGQRVDTLLQEHPDWNNADYLLDDGLVVAELKELQKDFINDERTQKRLSDIHSDWVQRGLIEPAYDLLKIQTDQLPPVCQEEFFQIFKRKLEAPISKAAKQIKETKERLGKPESRGLLILVNEGNTILTPNVIAFLLSRILKGQHSSIDQVLFCSVNLPMTGPNIPDQARFWIPFSVHDRPKVDEGLLERLQIAWCQVMDQAIGFGPQPVIDANANQNSLDSYAYKVDGLDFAGSSFVKAGKCYACKQTGRKYYCESVKLGVAHMFLVEARTPNGDLVQAEFQQSLVSATITHHYILITDKNEVKRIQRIVKRLRQPQGFGAK